MLSIIWLASAHSDLHKILTYIAYESPPAARRMKKLLEDSVVHARREFPIST
ncbi:hypothetical protein MCY_01692 [Bartonella rattimassiliensis 15908]|uniref:RelE/StbE family addiction module toxin n=1 Tax=Bartonella rattimassiliensis 15908 TaxID=1094556 RepID=J1JEW6_9HYPH|nr:type II toxin-antitoxin system RelE/ParE family toxin [Bartonella rattimassiliensis]EJF82635.1 hypothetical protein MCY_01692 [Bartonella rattimassiliensis 15908]